MYDGSCTGTRPAAWTDSTKSLAGTKGLFARADTDVYYDVYLKPLHYISSCVHCCRAGRDGQPSDSVLFCSQAELKQLKKLERPLRAGAADAVAQ
jgi:hypothetical protein